MGQYNMTKQKCVINYTKIQYDIYNMYKIKGKTSNHEHEKNKIVAWYVFAYTKGQTEE